MSALGRGRVRAASSLLQPSVVVDDERAPSARDVRGSVTRADGRVVAVDRCSGSITCAR